MRSQYVVGEYQAGEGAVTCRPHDQSTRRGVIFCHGAGGSALNALFLTDVPAQAKLVRALADSGHTVLAGDFGGSQTWGNDTSLARVGQAVTHLTALSGVLSGKVHLVGISMGGLVALNYAKANPTLVASVTAIIPTVDIPAAYDADISGAAALIDTAYGGTYVDDDQKADHNPVHWGPLESSFVPTKVWHASDDPWCPLASYQAFAATPNATLTDVGALGHSDAAIAASPINEIEDFLQENS